MLEVNVLKNKMSNCFIYRDLQAIQEIQNELTKERMEQDKFFSELLHTDKRYDEEMDDPYNVDTPKWKVYKSKLKEYDQVSELLTLCNYYNKVSYVQ